MKKIQMLFGFLLFTIFCFSQNGFTIIENKIKKEISIKYNNKLITNYCYYDSSSKPILFPVNTLDGITVTRSYPFVKVTGERVDHPHHTGIWLNYENVNGLDFWNNSTAIAAEKKINYGTIVHQKIVAKKTNGNKASLTTTANWVRPDKKILLIELTTNTFTVADSNLIIDRTTKLTATDTTVLFKDAKDGMYAIRVARELEMPAKDKTNYVDDKGNITVVASSGGTKVTGMYTNSDGVKGDSVWSTKSRWAILNGIKDGKNITIGMIDNPSNVGYPGYWHARGYGLFSINPLGKKIFSNGKQELNFTLLPHQSVTFKYRIIIKSGKNITANEMNKLADEFAQEK